MSRFAAIEARLRASRPADRGSPPPLDSVLNFIERAGEEPPGTPSPSERRWWQRTRVMVPAIAAAVVLAGAGGGALLLQQGAPLPAAYVLPANAETGLGQPEPASLTPLPTRVADPEGGPPWAMRVLRTTRGLVCLQAGRLVNGQLGGLGSGYAFGGDGRFHQFLAEDAIATDACPAVGREQAAFLPGPPRVMTANALPLAGENVAPGDRVHCDLPGEEDWGVRCPQAELRQVAVGLLGPEATSITVSNAGSSSTVKPYGPDGAYLIVLPAPPNANPPLGDAGSAPRGALLTVTYKDGTQCQIPPTGSANQCHAQGALGEAGALPSSLPATAIHAGYVPNAGHLENALMEDERGTPPNTTEAFRPTNPAWESAGPAASVSFTAPASAPNASTAYVVELTPTEVAGCATPSLIVSQPSSHDIKAGQQVQLKVPLESTCATSYTGRVFLAHSSSVGGEAGGEGPLYEVIARQYGSRVGGTATKFPTVGRFQLSVP